MSALDELGEKTRLQNPNMTALEWFVWNERNEPLAEEAAEELAALRARVEEIESNYTFLIDYILTSIEKNGMEAVKEWRQALDKHHCEC